MNIGDFITSLTDEIYDRISLLIEKLVSDANLAADEAVDRLLRAKFENVEIGCWNGRSARLSHPALGKPRPDPDNGLRRPRAAGRRCDLAGVQLGGSLVRRQRGKLGEHRPQGFGALGGGCLVRPG
jgi:hypothetical protein